MIMAGMVGNFTVTTIKTAIANDGRGGKTEGEFQEKGDLEEEEERLDRKRADDPESGKREREK
jgi:hypothetical protein